MPSWIRHALAIAALILGAWLGHRSLSLPAPARADAAGFSAERAMADIRVIAQAPHSVWDQPSLVPVREHITRRLASMGLPVSVRDYPEVTDRFGHRYPLRNLSAALPGRSGTSILLVAHYDSSPKKRPAEAEGSRGAADDGYGVATLLEIAQVLTRTGEPLQNGVRFLFTDAEETGLLGARAEMEANLAAYRDVNLVINVEARGVKGPAVMFETGRDNLASLGLYREAGRPFAYSFAVDVYRRMPNGTDLTEFIARGFAGLNFAVLDDLSYYHTPRDNPDNVSAGSLQHFGEQILPVVRAYARGAAYGRREAFVSRQDAVYFSWLPGTFYCWSRRADGILNAGLALACLVYAFWTFARGGAKVGPSFRWFLLWLGLAAGALGLGLGISYLVSLLTGIRWRLTYMPNVPLERPITWLLLLGVAATAYALAARSAKQGRSGFAPILGALALNLLVLGAMALVLPGGTFLFSMPLLASLAALVLAQRLRFAPVALAAPVLILSLFVPVLHLIALALTFGALGGVLLVAAFPLALAGAVAGGVGADA
jgi:hypothetical protein